MSRPLIRVLALLSASLALGGCALAPGMYVGDSLDPEQNEFAPDAPPPGRVTLITPALIKEQRAKRSIEIPAEVEELFGRPKPYLIGAGDVLNIFVWDHPEFAITAAGGLGSDAGSLSPVGNGYNVSTEGLIQYPYVGVLKVGGLTENGARELLITRLAQYIKAPQVTVRIQSFRSGRVYFDGEVRLPGLQSINDIPLTLPEAIGRAGGFTATADRSSIALTRNGKTVNINLPMLIERGVNPARILMSNGDLINVNSREEAKVFVLGEVQRFGTLHLRNGHLTLNEALGDSGGVNPSSGDPRQVFVVRAANSDQPEIFHLDARSPIAFALAEGFELQSRDVIYVDPVPVVRWNRVISLILPSAQAITTVSATRSSITP